MKKDVENAADARMPGDAAEDRRVKRGGGKALSDAMKKPVRIKPSHKGLLHRKLNVPQGQPIPAAKLAAALKSSSSSLRKEANFARNFGR